MSQVWWNKLTGLLAFVDFLIRGVALVLTFPITRGVHSCESFPVIRGVYTSITFHITMKQVIFIPKTANYILQTLLILIESKKLLE